MRPCDQATSHTIIRPQRPVVMLPLLPVVVLVALLLPPVHRKLLFLRLRLQRRRLLGVREFD